MADFCKECSIEMFNEDFRELAGIVPEGQTALVICEGCGFIRVDHNGVRLSYYEEPTP